MKLISISFLSLGLIIISESLSAQQTGQVNNLSISKSEKKPRTRKPIRGNEVPRLSVTAGLGTANYYGDLVSSNKLFIQTSASAAAGVTYELLPQLNLRADLGFQRVQGADGKPGGAHPERNLSFKSNIFDFSTSLEFSFFNLNRFKLSPYVSGGIGFMFFNPFTTSATGQKTYLRELGTEGQLLSNSQGLYKKSTYEIPVGVGLKYVLSRRLMAQFEFNFRITGTDYLDDVSKNGYVDKAALDAVNPLSSKFAYRGYEVGGEPYPKNLNLPRGNPNNRDNYYVTQLKLAYALIMRPVGEKALPALPAAKEAPKDTDGDGIIDLYDRCPDVAGLKYLQGCPDRDGDGIADIDDKCPDVPGFTRYEGCPIPDTDGDGVNDEMDKCPNEKGTARYQGCPVPDTDGDGVNDDEDRCITEKGTAANFGCPEISKELIDRVNLAAKNVFFNTASAELLPKSFKALDDVVKILNENPSYKIHISGYTDNRGDVLYNQTLSDARAAAVGNYLKSKGIEVGRLSSAGYGELNPIATNNTPAGQAENRRVEMKLSNY